MVYRCVDLRLGRAVAAKVMDAKYIADPVFRQRFRREARAMAQLTHPNLINVYDFGSDGDHLFLVMELITGGTLRELLAERGPMPPHAATAVMRSVLTGLSAAHSVGLIHRDMKPDNVLINTDHRVKLADFGLVRVASSTTHSSDQIVGTVAYLAPEQVDGTEITRASDVYSAGLVLYELLTGSTPFSGETPLEHAYQRLNTVVPAPSSQITGIPPLFDALVATATSSDPADRFVDAGEFLAALDDVANELALPAFTVPVPTNSAAHRAAAVPTDIADVVGHATGVIDMPATDHTAELPPVPPYAGVQETAITPQIQPPLTPQTEPGPSVPSRVSEEFIEEPEPPEPSISNRSRLKLFLWLIVVLVLTIAVAIGGWWFGSGRYGDIPQVLGMDRIAATSVVEDAGFVPATRIVYSDDIPADQIAGTEPTTGERVVRGQEVTVLVSQGQPTVPAGRGQDILTFQALAEERTLDIETGDPVYSPTATEGVIAETTPSEGEAVPIGSTITVHISRGPEPVQLPDFEGTSLSSVEQQLTDLGINIGSVERRYDPEAPADQVLEMSPPAGTTVSRGDAVSLVISNALVVPEIIGMDLAAAIGALESAGFTVEDTERDRSETGASADTIISVTPKPGTLSDPEDASVTLGLPGRVTVPSVEGMTVAQARTAMEEVGLKINADKDDDDRVVTRQRPSAGDDQRVDSTVRLTLERESDD